MAMLFQKVLLWYLQLHNNTAPQFNDGQVLHTQELANFKKNSIWAWNAAASATKVTTKQQHQLFQSLKTK